MSPRQRAIAAGERRYHGRPCRNCGGTERQVGDCHCVVCKRSPKNMEASRQRTYAHYWNMTGVEYNRRLLYWRRHKALKRMELRNQRRQEEAFGGSI